MCGHERTLKEMSHFKNYCPCVFSSTQENVIIDVNQDSLGKYMLTLWNHMCLMHNHIQDWPLKDLGGIKYNKSQQEVHG